MRILCLTPRLPYPPDRGDRLRAYRILQTLAPEHELSLLSFSEGAVGADRLEPLQRLCRSVRTVELSRARSLAALLGNGWRRLPLQALYYRSGAMRRLVAETLSERSFDAVYVHLFRMAPYAEWAGAPYRIVDLTDVISRELEQSLPYRGLASRMLYRLETRRIERYEREVAASADEVWLVSEVDRAALLERCPTARAHLVANGVDCGRFRPLDEEEDPNRLVFSGHMSVFHNVDAAIQLADEILPLVQRTAPACRLRLVGAAPCAKVLRLGGRPDVEVTGFVPDLNRELNRAAVVVAPLRFAAGVQNKVLEAMAAARPVVTTSRVAGGLGAEAGRDLLVGEDAGEIARQVAALLVDTPLRRRMGAAARRLVEQRFTWRVVAERVREIEQQLGAR